MIIGLILDVEGGDNPLSLPSENLPFEQSSSEDGGTIGIPVRFPDKAVIGGVAAADEGEGVVGYFFKLV